MADSYTTLSAAETEEIVNEAYAEAERLYPENEGQGHFERLLIEATIHAIERRLCISD